MKYHRFIAPNYWFGVSVVIRHSMILGLLIGRIGFFPERAIPHKVRPVLVRY